MEQKKHLKREMVTLGPLQAAEREGRIVQLLSESSFTSQTINNLRQLLTQIDNFDDRRLVSFKQTVKKQLQIQQILSLQLQQMRALNLPQLIKMVELIKSLNDDRLEHTLKLFEGMVFRRPYVLQQKRNTNFFLKVSSFVISSFQLIYKPEQKNTIQVQSDQQQESQEQQALISYKCLTKRGLNPNFDTTFD